MFKEQEVAHVSELPLKEELEAYLEERSDTISLELAEAFYDRDKPVANTAVIIPVAAHQDADWIRTSMSQYARQTKAEPFTIFLYLNSPIQADRTEVARSVAAVQQAQAEFPWLNIRYAERECDSYSPTIGEIRKDVWDAVLRVALRDGIYDVRGGDIVGINHDIDTPWIGQHYVRNVQAHYRLEREKYELSQFETLDEIPWDAIGLCYTQVKHEYPFRTHPNAAKAIFWNDFVGRQSHRGGSYTNGMVMSFLWYAKQLGFDISKASHELENFMPNGGAQGILRTPMHTSERRFMHRLGAHGLSSMWTPGSFSARDQYRTEGAPGDISEERLKVVLLETFNNDIDQFPLAVSLQAWTSIVEEGRKHADNEMVLDMWLFRKVAPLVERRLELARQVLTRVVQLPELSGRIDRTHADRVVQLQAKRLKAQIYMPTR